MIKNILYFLLKQYVRLALHFYYKSYRIEGAEHIPKGPVIFAANHQNAFMDALLVTCSTGRNPYFLARASIFTAKWAIPLLKILRIIPIYRIRDGISNVKKNVQIFNECSKLLIKNEAILMFPEGNHMNQFRLRPLQKGIARLAFESENKSQFNLNLKIIPVGIQYDDYDGIGNSVLISFASPIKITDYQVVYEKNVAEAFDQLMNDIRSRIADLILDMGPADQYEDVYRTWKKLRNTNNNLQHRVRNDQQLIESIKNSNVVVSDNSKEANRILNKVIHYPLYIITKINLIIPDLWISWYVRERLREPMFEGSMRFALWLFPGIIMLFIQTYVLYLLTGVSGAAFGYILFSLMIAGIAIKTKP